MAGLPSPIKLSSVGRSANRDEDGNLGYEVKDASRRPGTPGVTLSRRMGREANVVTHGAVGGQQTNKHVDCGSRVGALSRRADEAVIVVLRSSIDGFRGPDDGGSRGLFSANRCEAHYLGPWLVERA